jgi:glutamate carboxypeptidase
VQHYLPTLNWIARQQRALSNRVVKWAKINTGSANVPGLKKLAKLLQRDFAVLKGTMRTHHLPPMITLDRRATPVQTPLGPAISIINRPRAALRVFCCIHMDTVYAADDPFQKVTVSGDHIHGPGVTDAKGGLAVMLTALQAFEQCPFASKIGWEILINPDEEVGSPGSIRLLQAAAKRNHFGLLFEPSLPDGALVDRRKGSGNFSIVVRGRSAHAGRDFSRGRSAIVAAAQLTSSLHELNRTLAGVTVNVGAIDGGGPVNVVPDLAICRFNIRTQEPRDEVRAKESVDYLVSSLNLRDGIKAELHGQFSSPPKIPDHRGVALLEFAMNTGRDIGLNLTCRPSGGASDGNKLAAAGLPNLDNLGPRGGDIHSPGEFLIPSSLVERAQLTALLLMKFASGELKLPDKKA